VQEVIDLANLEADSDDFVDDAPLSALSAIYCDDPFFG
jgi:hypothetical protein